MAYQGSNRKPEQQPTAGKIVKTPAPDLVDHIRGPSGNDGYGLNGPQNRSWCAPGHAVESPLATNLRESQADSEDVLSKIIAGGVAGRDDNIPADAVDWQRRKIDDTPYQSSFGQTSRQANSGSPGGTVPEKTGWNPGVPVRQPPK